MSVKYASASNTDSKAAPNVPYVQTEANPWVRPSDWLTLPTLLPTDNKVVGLFAVYDDNFNNVALTTTGTSNFDVDWGDGTSSLGITSGSTVNHTYTFSSLSPSTLTSRGYRQAIITVTPSSGTFSSINLNLKNTSYLTRWLDIAIAGPSISQITFMGSTPVVSHGMLEQINIVSTSTGNTGFYNYLFQGLVNLQSVLGTGSINNYNSLTSTFAGCTSLEVAPMLPSTSATQVSMFGTFNGCSALKYVPNYTFTVGGSNSFINTFQNCYSLLKAPNLDLTKIDSGGSAFNNCYSLVEVPAFRFPTATTFTASSFFANCYSLEKIPFMDLSKCTDLTSFFSNCRSITTVPFFNTVSCTNMSGMFTNCYNLMQVPLFNTGLVTNMSNMFANCYNLTEVPLFNTQNVINMGAMLSGCSSLTTIPQFNTVKVTSMDNFLQNCVSVTEIPLLNTSNVTTMVSFLNSCRSLTEIPLFDTSNCTNMNSAFSTMSALITLPMLNTSKNTNFNTFVNSGGIQVFPALNTSNGTSFNSMFNGSTSLYDVAAFDTSKATTASTIFSGTSSLVNIPSLNFANVTTLPGQIASTSSVQSSGVANIKISHSYASCGLEVASLESIMNNLGANATSPTLTISSNPGATTTYTSNLTAGQAAGSTTLTVGASSSYNVGWYVTNSVCFAPAAVTLQDLSDIVIRNNHGLADGTRVSFATIVTTTGISVNTVYYVVNSTTNTFQLSLTNGGAVLPLTTNGSGTLRFEVYITGKPSSTQVTVSAPTTATTTATALLGRPLNTYLASLKNWTITG